jgi:hypothetical protein
MQNLKTKLEDQGLAASMVVRETGARTELRFGRGERSKTLKLTLGPVTFDAQLMLVDIPGAPEGKPNLTLTIVTDGVAAPTTLVEGSAVGESTEVQGDAGELAALRAELATVNQKLADALSAKSSALADDDAAHAEITKLQTALDNERKTSDMLAEKAMTLEHELDDLKATLAGTAPETPEAPAASDEHEDDGQS